MKVVCEKAEEIYNFLEKKCKNLDNNCWKTLNENDCYKINESVIFSISYDHKLTMKEVFGEDCKLESKKEVKKSDKNEESKSTPVEENNAPKKENKTSMDQKYDDLKKLKELLDNDILTKEEYDREKNKILEG